MPPIQQLQRRLTMKIKTFIPAELRHAPRYPLGTPPNLTLRTVAVDACTSFEVWSPGAKALLLPEEADLLRSDRLRVEVICSKLVWLVGATCSEREDGSEDASKCIYDWEEVIDFASKYKFYSDIVDVVFCPQTIRPIYRLTSGTPTHWVIEPANWEIFLLALKPSKSGFKVESRAVPLRIHLWTGKPITRAI